MSEPLITLKQVTSPLNDISLPSGGVILKSSDGVEFKVYKNILALASPFFRQMFTLPQPGSQDAVEGSDLKPQPEVSVVEVSETSTALDILLRLIYPIAPPQFPGTSDSGEVTDAKELVNGIEPVLDAAIKYDMVLIVKELCARLLAAANTTLADGSAIDDTLALRVFVLACRHGLREEARHAAYASLKGRVAGVFIDELRSITAAQYFHLVQFHTKIVAAVDSLVQFTNASGTLFDQAVINCAYCGRLPTGLAGFPNWWKDFVNRAQPIMHESPKTMRVFNSVFLENMFTTARICTSSCNNQVHGKWQTVSQIIRDTVDRAITEVSLNTKH